MVGISPDRDGNSFRAFLLHTSVKAIHTSLSNQTILHHCLHPDKLLKTSETSNSSQTTSERFLKVHKAWEILSDSATRLFYDKELKSSRREDFLASEVAEDLSLQDMTAEDAGETLELFYQCRCGDYYTVDSLELQKIGYSLSRDGNNISISILNVDTLPGSMILPCGSCSLKARLVLSTDNS
ncbi:hypothetical protein P8452_37411 [Trifolium repens]|nr:hypothetical protein P8452_37411 [Trifolium repens]